MSDYDKIFNDKIELRTIHSAKGNEYKVVFLICANQGFLPYTNSNNQILDIEEERRVFFVGITRSMERIYFSS
jgi:DNA helicase-2/ATP-dependent DNA helicase PcrA